jgi:putative Mg2+ transporter-C (MgtC) family protein
MNIADPQAFGEILFRLGAAVLSGAVLGADRDLNQKPAGMRTLALVSLGSAAIVMTGRGDLAHATELTDATARVVQGVFAGIGFLGGGVILHHKQENTVFGLTTAATIWVAAGTGVAWGLGLWMLALTSLVLAILILIPGVWVEHFIVGKFKRPPRPIEKRPSADDR